MVTKIEQWQMVSGGEPLVRADVAFRNGDLRNDQVLVEVAGCGVCHTDLGFLYDGVRPRHALPLTLGHEIAGRIVAAGSDTSRLMGKSVVVPAVIPCGECEACKAGRGAVCPAQFFPGNDDHGGFASHVVVPGKGLCVVDDEKLDASGIDLAELSVVADALTTPYQAIVNANLGAGDVAVFVGAGGVGAFGVQLAASMGARVIAIDVDPVRLDRIKEFGAGLCITSGDDQRAIKNEIRAWVKEHKGPSTGWKIFETSGHPKGQELAFSLLNHDAHLAVVGYTREKTSIRLSNLMAFDATARGTWGCLPKHYPSVVNLVLEGKVKLGPFVERFSMSDINDVLQKLHAHSLTRRPILIPDF